MCRWLAYSGNPLYLEELIFDTDHSLIDQSLAARRSETPTNGDGFGIGWYGERPFPGLYKEVRPAWNDRNLKDLAAQIRSPLFLAHVRAATGTEIQRSNCHPFRHGRWLFVHNGVIEGFDRVKRDLAFAVTPELYGEIAGTTDSEIMFYLALTFGLEQEPVAAVARMAGLIEEVGRRHGVENPLHMTLGITDGERIHAFRYSTQKRSRTLFFNRSVEALEALNPAVDGFSSRCRAVVSEPLSDLTAAWEEIPESSVVLIDRGVVEQRPFAPQPPA